MAVAKKKPAAKKAPAKAAKPAAKKAPEKKAKPLPKKASKPLPKAKAKPLAKKPAAKKPAPKKAAAKKPEVKKPTAGAAYHLAKREEDGVWTVKLTNSTKVIKIFDTKAEAEAYVKGMAERQGRSVLTHNSKGKNKGRIQSK